MCAWLVHAQKIFSNFGSIITYKITNTINYTQVKKVVDVWVRAFSLFYGRRTREKKNRVFDVFFPPTLFHHNLFLFPPTWFWQKSNRNPCFLFLSVWIPFSYIMHYSLPITQSTGNHTVLCISGSFLFFFFPPTCKNQRVFLARLLLGKQVFIIMFFPPTQQKNPCRDPSTIEYSVNALSNCAYWY